MLDQNERSKCIQRFGINKLNNFTKNSFITDVNQRINERNVLNNFKCSALDRGIHADMKVLS